VNAEDSRFELPWTWVRIPFSPKKLDGNNGPLDGRWQKTNENNKDCQMGQVTPKKYLKKVVFAALGSFCHLKETFQKSN